MEALFRRDRLVVSGALAVLIALSWLYLVRMASAMSGMDMVAMPGMAEMPGMPDMPGMAMPQVRSWGFVDLASLFLMWTVMMVAMMAPTAAPMTLAFLSVNRNRGQAGRRTVSAGLFLGGYLVVWTAFSAGATTAQWGLHEAAVLSSGMALTSPRWAGAVLIVAGVFQWTPLKHACLSHCRSPLSFLMTEWREGAGGALIMGVRHGVYCVGCCWILMALLFVVGVMNLLWVAAISVFVLMEKTVPAGQGVARAAGLVLVGVGLFLFVRV